MTIENYSTLKTLFLEEVLVGTTSAELSKELGYKFDKFRRWLNNESILKTEDFFKICNIKNLNVSLALDLFKFDLSFEGSFDNLFKHLSNYNVIESNKDLSDYLNCHISVVKRYSKNEVDPNIEVILKLMDFKAHHLPLFFRRLFNAKVTHPIFRSWVIENSNAPSFESSLPLSSMIEAVISLDSFKNIKNSHEIYLAELLEHDVDEIKLVLGKMLTSGVIKNENEVLAISNNTTNLDGLTLQDVIPFIIKLNQKMIKILEKRKDPNFILPWTHGVMAYRVFPSSIESVQKINSILLKANSEILKTLEEDTNPKVEARAVLMQSFGVTK
jgi:hypothetical protein